MQLGLTGKGRGRWRTFLDPSKLDKHKKELVNELIKIEKAIKNFENPRLEIGLR